MVIENRNHTIDILKGIAITLVVFGHITHIDILHDYIWSFHMPIFFIISGFLFQPAKYSNFTIFFKKKIASLILPYFIFGVATYIYWLLVERRFRGNELDPLAQLVGLFYGSRYGHFLDFNGPLWFIPCLFSMSVLFYFVQKLKGEKRFAVVLCLFVSGVITKGLCPWLPFGMCAASIGSIFYWWGGQYVQFLETFTIKNKYVIILIIILFVGIQFIMLPYSNANLAKLEIGNPIIYLSLAFVGFIVYYMSARLIGSSSVLEWLGKNSLVIFALHGPVYRALLFCCSHIINTSVSDLRENILGCLIMTICTMSLITPFICCWIRWGQPLIHKFSR